MSSGSVIDVGISPKIIHGKYTHLEFELINPVLNFPKKYFLFYMLCYFIEVLHLFQISRGF